MIDLTKSAGGFFFASTRPILMAALRQTFGHTNFKATVWSLRAGWHYTFPIGCVSGLDDLNMEPTVVEQPKPTAKVPVFNSWSEYYKRWPRSRGRRLRRTRLLRRRQMSNAAFHSIAEMDKAVWAVWALDIRIVIDALKNFGGWRRRRLSPP